MMRRREFITLLGGAAAWPLAARAQQPGMPVIGFLGSESPKLWMDNLRAFRQGLSETGYVEDRNVAITYRWAEGQYDRLPAMAVDLVRQKVDVIAAPGGVPSALAAKAATTTVPIVFRIGADPVQVGLVVSLNRPGANLTGVTALNSELGPKRLELLHESVPTATSVALLVNPANPDVDTVSRGLQVAARALGLQTRVLYASTEREIDTALTTLDQLRTSGLVVGADNFLGSRGERLAALALRYAVPAIHGNRSFAAAGGLMSYSTSSSDPHRLAGIYTGRVLKGEKPADLPVQQATKVELIINLKTAKALGLTIPPSVLAIADEAIE
jgi:putative ABC transport system substrate-binding protein